MLIDGETIYIMTKKIELNQKKLIWFFFIKKKKKKLGLFLGFFGVASWTFFIKKLFMMIKKTQEKHTF